MLGGADNPNGELPSYITGADNYPVLTPGKSNSVAAYTILRMTWLSTHQSQKSILRMA